MTQNDEAGEATPKRSRKKAVNFAKRRTLRFSDGEERVVDDVRRALAKSSGRDVEDVSFSEALRLIITNKPAVADVEAKALAIERSGTASADWGLYAISDRLAWELGYFRIHVARIGGNLNQIAKRLNMGDPATAAEISEALEGVADMRVLPDEIERRIAILVGHGLPPRGAA
ncbi:MobC family plasmid mobilization relaxosome protein [Diaminobutyricibacter tongyongensis]|uniref:MobC family plasmid mobilization relaxosome protein n=1 Tax=Leifsonia tongyongensis TaxID=1268043 RepID=A0A6L9XTF7_9MICO|nr:plasmid mobilization relaxosome protein MobC [Diaminobutyricibacter tongyongensis]NEN04653.1 MobC family plasmid mobilization relaxosome protein [Diaminobutyricibacter tongyongensis]